MPHIPGPDALRLVTMSQLALGLSQEKLGTLLGVSRRTVSRWVSRRSNPEVGQLQKLARAVYPVDASLASALAGEGGQSLESLGLVRPAPPPAPVPAPSRPFPPVRLLVESVVCAAAEAMQAPPSAVRDVLRAALTRAQALGLSVEEMNDALAPAAEPTPPSRRKRGT